MQSENTSDPSRLATDQKNNMEWDFLAQLLGRKPDTSLPLLDWGCKYLPRHFTAAPSAMHTWLGDQLDTLKGRRGTKINVVGPRGGAKSTLVTLAYVLRMALEGREPYIWIVSDTQHQACAHLENIKVELADNPRIAADFSPEARTGRRWRAHAILLESGVAIDAFGTGQRIRGRRRRENRPTLIVCDDLQNDQHMDSARQRDYARRWFQGTLLKAGTKRTNIVHLATALHRDALGLELHRTPGWTSRIFRAIARWPDRMDLWQAWEEIYADVENPAARSLARGFFDSHRQQMECGAELLWPAEEDLYTLMCMRAESGRTAFDPTSDFTFVTVKECADQFGAGVTGDELTVALLPNSKGDPNLVTGDVISFVDMPDGSLVCVSAYMDDPIGTVKMFDTPDVPLRPGWQCMSAMEAEGGRFPLGTCSDGQMGETGGTLSHNHGALTGAAGGHDHGGATATAGAHDHGGATGTGGDHDHGGFTGYATADLTVDPHSTTDVAGCVREHAASDVAATLVDHTAHMHTLPSNYRAADGEPQLLVYNDEFLTTPDFDYPLTEAGPEYNHRKHFGTEAGGLLHQGTPDPSGEVALVHAISEPNEGTGHKHAINEDYGHTHTISSQAAHAHTITAEGNHQHTISGASHLNPYYKIKFIRRIDNAA